MWINSKTQNDWCVQLLISVIPCYYLHRSHSHGLEIQVEVLTVGLASWNTKNIKVTQKEDRINNEFVRGGGKKRISSVSLPLCSLKHRWHFSTEQTKGKEKVSLLFLSPALPKLWAELLLLSPSQGNVFSIWLKNDIICHKSVSKSSVNITL